MGQFFRFVNKATKGISTIPIGNNQGSSYSVNLHLPTKPDKTVLNTFKQVSLSNQWELKDMIAVGDYGNLVWIENDLVTYGYIADEQYQEYKDLYTSIWEN